ncbi:ABC transporter permease [Zavarzinia sp. CC-PAN008]|uniref:ABC transporter permease n=1 Tax=Zavarzinia sp. CC-PAN008 TaxID=3243332 RepID=UPI003F744C94
MPLSVRLALRELRGGLKGFRVFLACLALGVMAIAGVGSLAAAIGSALDGEARTLLGGDIELRLTSRAVLPQEQAWMAERAEVSRMTQMRAMAYAVDNDERTLVELKAVDDAYPLFGAMALEPAGDLPAALAQEGDVFGAVADPELLVRLDIAVGQTVRVGTARLQIRAAVAQEPDRGSDAFSLGPRLMVSRAALAATGLIQPGSLFTDALRLKLPGGADLAATTAAIREAFPDAAWRLRSSSEGAPGLSDWVERLALFLSLVGLTALLVGGVGVGNAVAAHMQARTRTIATLKCLGATSGLIVRTYLVQVMLIACLGIAAGLALGAAIPPLAGSAVGELLPVQVRFGLYPGPLLLAAFFGLLVSLAFALVPLARAHVIPPAGLFRALVVPPGFRTMSLYYVLAGLAFAVLGALVIATAVRPMIAIYFVIGAAAAFVVLRAAGWAIVRLTASLPRPRRPGLRLALANLHRPGAPTATVILSLGLGLTLLVIVALIEGNLIVQVEQRLPDQAPTFFFVDVQSNEADAFDQTIASIPGARLLDRVASLRGRISAINGTPTERWDIAPEGRWAARGDRGLTYATALPEGSTLVAGEWWPVDYRGPPLISFDAAVAQAMNIGVGDRLTINVLGRDVEATIASLRRIDYTNLGINFAIIFAPGVLEAAPHTFLATAKADGPAGEALYKAVTDRFPNISAVRIQDALDTVEATLRNLATALEVSAAVTLVAGVLVLAGAMAAGQRHRLYDAVILKVLGATGPQVVRAYLLEYLALGLAAATIGAALGTAAAWAIITQLMNLGWTWLPLTVLATALAAIAVTVVLGLGGTWRALRQRPAPVLRQA